MRSRERSCAGRRLLIPLWLGLVLAGCSSAPEARSARYLATGKSQMARKDYSRAVLQFRNAVRLTPDSSEAHYQLALALFELGDGHNALASAAKAVQLDSGNTAAKILQAQVLASSPEASMVAAAETLAESIVAGAPAPAAFDSLALAEIRLGKLEEAEKHLKEALDRFPAHLSLSVKLAIVKLQQKDFAGAEQALREAASKDRNSAAPAIALGSLLLLRGNLAAAEEQFRAALEIAPADGTALFNLAAVQHRLGRRAEAAETLRKLSEVPDDAYKPLRAVYLFQKGEHDKAIAEFKRLYLTRKDDRRALSDLVTAYAVLGRFQDAATILNEQLEKNPSNIDALLLRARIYLQLGDLEKAEGDLLPALSSQYRSGEAHYLYAAIFGARGQLRRRKAELAEALAADPRNLAARVELCQLLLAANAHSAATSLLNETPADQRGVPAIIVQRNWIRLSRNEQNEAERDLKLLLANERIPEAVLQKAVLAFWRKDYRAANDLAAEVLTQKPGDVRAMELVFKINVAQGQMAAGIQRLKDYAAVAGRSAPAQFFVGAVLRSAGQADGARAAFETALRADPNFHRAQIELAGLDDENARPEDARQRLLGPAAKNDVTALLMLADLDYKAGNIVKAIAGYRKVVNLDAENVTALNNLAFLLVEHSHDADTALDVIQRAKRLDPENSSVDDTLGWIQLYKGSLRAAVSSLERAASRQPTARRLYHLATAQYRLGNRAQATEAYEKAYKLDPKLPEARTAIAAASQR